MEKAYQNVSLFFVAILAFVVWGFFRTYFSLFPTFNGITAAQHFHGLLLLSWFAMLIVQPMLIRYKKYELHRQLGKLSYILVPLILVSIFSVTKGQYLRMANILPPAQNIGGIALDVPIIFAFGAFYILAMVHKKNAAYHMRYMIATSLLMLGPGTGRAFIMYAGMSFHNGVFYSTILTELIAVGLIVYDLINQRPYKPYVVTLIVLLVCHLTWQFQMAQWWQLFGGKFAQWFF